MWTPTLPARTALSAAVPLGTALLAAACAGGPGPSPAFTGSPAEVGRTEVHVFNGRWEDLTIYLVQEGAYHRLGEVTGKTSRVLRIPDRLACCPGWMRLVAAHPDHVPHARSAEFQIIRGERARWSIELYAGPSPVVY